MSLVEAIEGASSANTHHKSNSAHRRPKREDAEAAVRVMIEWAGDDPDREGLVDTPARVVRAYEEFFEGYQTNPVEMLQRTFEETDGYDDLIVLKNLRFESHCEHHIVPIIGKVHIAYLPAGRVVGISKLARVVEVFAKRLQIQETLTAQIAEAINTALKPRGVAVVMEAAHMCMTTRGIKKPGVSMMTRRMLGEFSADKELRRDFLNSIAGPQETFG